MLHQEMPRRKVEETQSPIQDQIKKGAEDDLILPCSFEYLRTVFDIKRFEVSQNTLPPLL